MDIRLSEGSNAVSDEGDERSCQTSRVDVPGAEKAGQCIVEGLEDSHGGGWSGCEAWREGQSAVGDWPRRPEQTRSDALQSKIKLLCSPVAG